jgi:predicted nucleotidyltransferase
MINVGVDHERLAVLCRAYGVQRLSFFGSVVRGEVTPESDLDVLVEFAPNETPSLLTLGGLQQELTALFGREVDLKTPGFLSRHFREDVMRTSVVQYAA